MSLTPVLPIIQSLAKTHSIAPFDMMQIVAKIQRDNDIPLINDPKGNVASVSVEDVDRIHAGFDALAAAVRANV